VSQDVVVKAANRLSQLELVRACQEAEWVLNTGAEVEKVNFTVKQLLQKLPIGDGAQEKELVGTVSRLQQLVSETDVLLLLKEVEKAEFEELLAAQRAQFEERLATIQPKLLVSDYALKESKNWSQELTVEVDGFVYAQGRAYNCGPLMTLTIDGFAHLIAYVGTTTYRYAGPPGAKGGRCAVPQR
jgi:hypothetical protein